VPRSVLIVDDNPRVRTIMSQFFGALPDWTVGGEAENGIEAIQKATKVKPDLVLLDYSMPKMTGIETASVLKKVLPDVYIVIFTLFDDSVSSRLTLASGVDLVVPKTEGLSGLVQAMAHLMIKTALTEG
jgi:DNA-binding NarL/FixJ family response regulator